VSQPHEGVSASTVRGGGGTGGAAQGHRRARATRTTDGAGDREGLRRNRGRSEVDARNVGGVNGGCLRRRAERKAGVARGHGIVSVSQTREGVRAKAVRGGGGTRGAAQGHRRARATRTTDDAGDREGLRRNRGRSEVDARNVGGVNGGYLRRGAEREAGVAWGHGVVAVSETREGVRASTVRGGGGTRGAAQGHRRARAT